MSRPRRRGRDVHGVLLLDKPQGASSNDVLQKVKRIYNANRAGHTGALDPLATGMLPICLGEATKFSQYLLDSDKRYRVIAKLGQRTDTSDADGQVVEERPLTFSDEQLAAALDSFRGETQQVPSMYSALKYQGKKLYEYARQGIEVPREARPITVYELLFIRREGDELELEIHCSKGTYIRTICEDVGRHLGCGAAMESLCRIASGAFKIEDAIDLYELVDTYSSRRFEGEKYFVEPAGEDALCEIEKLVLPTDYPLTHFGSAVMDEAMGKKFIDGWHISFRDCEVTERPEFEQKEPEFEIRPEYRGAYKMYRRTACGNDFLGVAFYSPKYKKLVADKVFCRNDEEV